MDPNIKYRILGISSGKLIKEEAFVKILKSGKKPLFKSEKKIKLALKELIDTYQMIRIEIKKIGQTNITSEGVENENFFFGPPKGVYYLTNSKESVGRLNEFLDLRPYCIYEYENLPE